MINFLSILFLISGSFTNAKTNKIIIPDPAKIVLASIEYANILIKIQKSCKATVFSESIESTYDQSTNVTKVTIEFAIFTKYKKQQIAIFEAYLASQLTDVPLSITKVNLIPIKDSCLKAN